MKGKGKSHEVPCAQEILMVFNNSFHTKEERSFHGIKGCVCECVKVVCCVCTYIIFHLYFSSQWSLNPKRLIFAALCNDLINYFIVCFEHQCNAMRAF